jgi:hypothetical protein
VKSVDCYAAEYKNTNFSTVGDFSESEDEYDLPTGRSGGGSGDGMEEN